VRRCYVPSRRKRGKVQAREREREREMGEKVSKDVLDVPTEVYLQLIRARKVK
jgi:hypothetical protein